MSYVRFKFKILYAPYNSPIASNITNPLSIGKPTGGGGCGGGGPCAAPKKLINENKITDNVGLFFFMSIWTVNL